MEEKVVVFRLLKYEGPRDWVEKTLAQSFIRPTLTGRLNPNASTATALAGEITEVYSSELN